MVGNSRDSDTVFFSNEYYLDLGTTLERGIVVLYRYVSARCRCESGSHVVIYITISY